MWMGDSHALLDMISCDFASEFASLLVLIPPAPGPPPPLPRARTRQRGKKERVVAHQNAFSLSKMILIGGELETKLDPGRARIRSAG